MFQDRCTRAIHSPPPAEEGTVMDSLPISAGALSPFLKGVKALCRIQSFGSRPDQARLISIRYSHYNERARWALDLSPMLYTEDAHPPGFAQFAIQDVTGGRKSASPVLVLPDGEVLDDSAMILRRLHEIFPEEFSWLYPGDQAQEIRDLEDELSVGLGAPVRQFAYAIALDGPNYRSTRPYLIKESAGIEKLLFFLGGRRIGQAIVEIYNCRSACIPHAEEALRRVFQGLSERLEDGREYLCGDSFTAADLTFAALAWPLVMPALWEESGLFLSYAELPMRWRERVEEFRSTPAGAHALRMYRRHRFSADNGKPRIAAHNPGRW